MAIGLIVLKLGVSALLGLIIGLEREIKHKPAGLKTSIIVSVISCLLTIVSIEAAYTFHKEMGIQMDPMRLTAQVVSGIGFLGAGVILIRKNESITGLTTASLVWGAAGLGIAVGAGFIKEALIGSVLLLISIVLIPYLLKICGIKALREKSIKIRLTVEKECDLTRLFKEIKAKEATVRNVRIKDMEGGNLSISLHIYVHENRYTTDIYYAIKEIEKITSVEIESL